MPGGSAVVRSGPGDADLFASCNINPALVVAQLLIGIGNTCDDAIPASGQ